MAPIKHSTVNLYIPKLGWPSGSKLPKWLVKEPRYRFDVQNVLKSNASIETEYLHNVLNGVNGIAKIQKALKNVAPLDPKTKISQTDFFERPLCNNKTLVTLYIHRDPEEADEHKAFEWYLQMNQEIWECERMDKIYFALRLNYKGGEKEVVFDDVFISGKHHRHSDQEHSDQEHSAKRQKGNGAA